MTYSRGQHLKTIKLYFHVLIIFSSNLFGMSWKFEVVVYIRNLMLLHVRCKYIVKAKVSKKAYLKKIDRKTMPDWLFITCSCIEQKNTNLFRGHWPPKILLFGFHTPLEGLNILSGMGFSLKPNTNVRPKRSSSCGKTFWSIVPSTHLFVTRQRGWKLFQWPWEVENIWSAITCFDFDSF